MEVIITQWQIKTYFRTCHGQSLFNNQETLGRSRKDDVFIPKPVVCKCVYTANMHTVEADQAAELVIADD